MKIIELLNKIANGEDVPEKIKYRNKIFIYDKDNQCYGAENYNEYYDLHMSLSNHKGTDLNYEVEIIDNEEWKTIVDFPNYEISTKGNIRTKQYCDKKGHIRQSKLLNKQINNCGYEYVILSNEFVKHKTLTVHRLAAKTFLDDYYDTLEVNHINGIKTDNRICNLEMVTHNENIKKRYEIGNDGNNYKEVEQFDLNGNYIATYKSSYEAERITGIGRTCIGGCCRNEHYTAGGYIWQFKSKEDKKIEKIYAYYDNELDEYVAETFINNNQYKEIFKSKYEEMLMFKINEIIDILNKGDNNENI